MEKPSPDLEIAQRVVAGDVHSFEEIVKKNQERVFRLCCSIVQKSLAEDAAQDIFVRVYESLNDFKGQSSLSTWIYRIAFNYCLNLLSKQKREKTESLDALTERSGEIPSLLVGTQSPLNALESKQIVHSGLEQLQPEERIILTMREMEGLTYKELAETLNISIDLVKVRLFRARKNFLNIVQKWL